MQTLVVKRQGSGIVLCYGSLKLGLDTGILDGTTLLSHAHMDHVGNLSKSKLVISTSGTLDTFTARGGRPTWRRLIVENGASIFHEDALIMSLNAGHVLGSSMFLIEIDNGPRVLYTGDFNVVDSLVHKAASAIQADVLITEATYGTPEWVFPDRVDIYHAVIEIAEETLKAGRIPRFRAYSLGKAQEAVALLQSGGFRVVVGNRSIESVCRVYNKHGHDLRYSPINEEAVRRLPDGETVFVTSSPNHTVRALMKVADKQKALDFETMTADFNLSGWALSEFGVGGFPLSAHSDFPGLVQFAQDVEPRIVYCFTRNAGVFSNHLAKNGLNAIPLE